MVANPLPSQDRLNELFHYEELTGQLIRKISVPKTRARVGDVAGTLQADGYRSIAVDGRRYLAHRIIWKMRYGKDPDVIDHIDGDRDNNKLMNLRDGNQLDNCRNQKIHRAGTAGISKIQNSDKYRAKISVRGYSHHLGCGTYDECVALRKAAEKKYWNHG